MSGNAISRRGLPMGISLGALLLVLVLLGCPGNQNSNHTGQEQAADVSLKVVKFPELEEAVRFQLGKVVVMVVWAEW